MEKIKRYCDYCGKECKDGDTLVLPVKEETTEWATCGGIKLYPFYMGIEIIPKSQYVCEDCQLKIANLLKILPRIEIVKGSNPFEVTFAFKE